MFRGGEEGADPKEGVSLQRLKKDIDEGDWGDLKLFTR